MALLLVALVAGAGAFKLQAMGRGIFCHITRHPYLAALGAYVLLLGRALLGPPPGPSWAGPLRAGP